MLKRSIGTLAMVFVLTHFGTPALAHHSFAAIFDKDQPFTVTGVINKVDWKNPHMYFYVDVTGADGAVVTWGFEGYPPTMMVRQGWSAFWTKYGAGRLAPAFVQAEQEARAKERGIVKTGQQALEGERGVWKERYQWRGNPGY